MKDSTFITRVVLKNYKSIAACDVQLQPLTFLVGRNGSGKSNFLDALRFVADALNSSLDHALRDRGGLDDIRHRLSGPPYLNIRLEFTLPDSANGYYAFSIESRSRGRYVVQTEECRIQKGQDNTPEAYFRVDNGKITDTSVKVAPAAVNDRLYLVNASGLPEFRPVYDAFSRMGFYNFNPDIIRDLQDSDPGDMLMQDGSNLTSVFRQLSSDAKKNIEEYLAVIVPGVHKVHARKFGPKETLQFKQYVAEDNHSLIFNANNMSDGTLHALGVLVALFQGDRAPEKRVPLVGIEEPEIALHPGAVAVLLDSLRDAAHRTQVIVTTHSPDLLEDKHIDVESILAVKADDGNTVIAPVDDASKSVVQDRLFTVGELLRSNQLQPDPAALPAAKKKQLSLSDFDKPKSAKAQSKGKHE
ncbi:AAA family ATPase [Candidatus Poribacteria bacterium]|nr:AAA family ATPase [Candidatus Poribacteria bacterium]MYH81047.1 AAA family ATPase [Candidatus Poribacteria bacterium]MYK93556.1 AAA family ATPase [Candidatus Poribacteria bacterium]